MDSRVYPQLSFCLPLPFSQKQEGCFRNYTSPRASRKLTETLEHGVLFTPIIIEAAALSVLTSFGNQREWKASKREGVVGMGGSGKRRRRRIPSSLVFFPIPPIPIIPSCSSLSSYLSLSPLSFALSFQISSKRVESFTCTSHWTGLHWKSVFRAGDELGPNGFNHKSLKRVGSIPYRNSPRERNYCTGRPKHLQG
ncbi:hypothetical protein K1719_029754 [Acacia pycnantha]|nr:hypothetical protein K1719_029754 [Acacia pycnantha]